MGDARGPDRHALARPNDVALIHAVAAEALDVDHREPHVRECADQRIEPILLCGAAGLAGIILARARSQRGRRRVLAHLLRLVRGDDPGEGRGDRLCAGDWQGAGNREHRRGLGVVGRAGDRAVQVEAHRRARILSYGAVEPNLRRFARLTASAAGHDGNPHT